METATTIEIFGVSSGVIIFMAFIYYALISNTYMIAFTGILMLIHFITFSSYLELRLNEYIAVKEQNEFKLAEAYCQKFSETIENVRLNTDGNKEFICTQNDKLPILSKWLTIEEINLKNEFKKFKKNKEKK